MEAPSAPTVPKASPHVRAGVDRLIEKGWLRKITRVGVEYRDGHVWGLYDVPSEDPDAPDLIYRCGICPTTGETFCGCLAGQNGRACKHRVLVEFAEMEAAGRVNRPALF